MPLIGARSADRPTPRPRVQGREVELPSIPPRKENASCCRSLRDDLGRYPVGFCSPECVRRPSNWAAQ